MKQRFFFIVSLIVIIVIGGLVEANAQEIVVNGDTIAQVTDTNFEAIFDKYTAKTGDAINNLIASVQANLTDEAQFVWKTYVMRYKVNWFSRASGAAFALFLFGLGMIGMNKWKWDEDASLWLSVPSMIIFIVMVIWSLSTLDHLLVPEYQVIQDLIGIIK
jgi:hypothetical protein